jgi:hypothetical protein
MNKATLQSDGSWKIETMSADEEAEVKAMNDEVISKKKADDDAVIKKAIDKASAKNKLKALGLTDDEIEALYS